MIERVLREAEANKRRRAADSLNQSEAHRAWCGVSEELNDKYRANRDDDDERAQNVAHQTRSQLLSHDQRSVTVPIGCVLPMLVEARRPVVPNTCTVTR